jgi:hypothetical protein
VLSDLNTVQQSVRSREHFDRNLGYVNRGAELLGELSSALKLLQESQVSKRIPGYAGLIADTMKASVKLLDIQSNLREIELLSTRAGDEAKFVQRLQDSREAYLTQLKESIQRLERMSAS